MQKSSRVEPKRNPVTRKIYQQQFFLQILLPVIIFTILLVALGVLAAFGESPVGQNQTAVWAHISTILMVINLFFSGIFILALFILIIIGFSWLLSKLPEYSFIAQLYLQLFGSKISSLADKSSSPFIAIQSAWAGVTYIFQKGSSKTSRKGK